MAPVASDARCAPSPLVSAGSRPAPGTGAVLQGEIRDPRGRPDPVVLSLLDPEGGVTYQYFCDSPGHFRLDAPATGEAHLMAFLDTDGNGPSPTDPAFRTAEAIGLAPGALVTLDVDLVEGLDLGEDAPWLDRTHGTPVAAADTEEEVRMQLDVRHEDPGEVLQLLGPLDGQVVADVGCGAGYYSYQLARAVGPTGRVLALDVREDLLAHLRQRAQQDPALDPHGNVRTVHSRLDDTTLEPGSTQTCFLAHLDFYVYPEITAEQRAFLRSCRDAITPDGRVVVLQWMGVQPPGTTDALVTHFEAAGLTLRSRDQLTGYDTWLFAFAQSP